MIKYDVSTLEDGRIQLEIGNLYVAFPKEADVDTVIGGINILVEKILGVSPFELTLAVLGELNKEDAAKEGEGENNSSEHTSPSEGATEVQREAGSHQEAGTAECSPSEDGKGGASKEG